jgi:hypothetical protein
MFCVLRRENKNTQMIANKLSWIISCKDEKNELPLQCSPSNPPQVTKQGLFAELKQAIEELDICTSETSWLFYHHMGI